MVSLYGERNTFDSRATYARGDGLQTRDIVCYGSSRGVLARVRTRVYEGDRATAFSAASTQMFSKTTV